jgi:hypothetical protein
MEKLKAFHRAEIEPLLGPCVGASEAEVAALEQRLGFALPVGYRDLLMWMGRDHHGALVGSDCFFNHIESNNQCLRELLAENHVGHPLPGSYVTVFTHQGYMAAWFELPPEQPDPPCHYYGEGEGLRAFASVSAFFLDQLRARLPAIKRVQAAGGIDAILRGRR